MPIKKGKNRGKRRPCNDPCAPSEIMPIGSWIQQSEKSLAKHVGRKHHLQMEFPPCVPGNKRSRKRHLRLLRERKLRQFRLNIEMLYCVISCPAANQKHTNVWQTLWSLESIVQVPIHATNEAACWGNHPPEGSATHFPGDFTRAMFLCLQSIGRPQPQPHCGSCESPANFEFGGGWAHDVDH